MSQKQLSTSVKQLLRLQQVLARVPISKSAWWEGCREGRFPQPLKLGPRTTVWRAEEIDAFIDRLGIQGVNNE